MSNFACEHCKSMCYDTPRGYITGCKHYPPDLHREEVTDLVFKIGMKNVLEGLLALTDGTEPYLKKLQGNLLRTYNDYEERYE